jgi:hypothetical protein
MASPLASAHIEAERRLRELIVSRVTAVWHDLGSWDRKDTDAFLRATLPLIDAGQRASAQLTDAYLAQALGRRPLGINPADVTGAAVRSGTPPDTVYQRPFITLWSALGEGKPFQDAFATATARLASTAAMDMQLSMRASANAVQAADDGIYGYERAADPGACEFCSLVDGAYVKSADAMPLHNNCGCGLEPLTEPSALAVNLPSGVAVHEHGELGPVLAAPGDHFTTEPEALS